MKKIRSTIQASKFSRYSASGPPVTCLLVGTIALQFVQPLSADVADQSVSVQFTGMPAGLSFECRIYRSTIKSGALSPFRYTTGSGPMSVPFNETASHGILFVNRELGRVTDAAGDLLPDFSWNNYCLRYTPVVFQSSQQAVTLNIDAEPAIDYAVTVSDSQGDLVSAEIWTPLSGEDFFAAGSFSRGAAVPARDAMSIEIPSIPSGAVIPSLITRDAGPWRWATPLGTGRACAVAMLSTEPGPQITPETDSVQISNPENCVEASVSLELMCYPLIEDDGTRVFSELPSLSRLYSVYDAWIMLVAADRSRVVFHTIPNDYTLPVTYRDEVITQYSASVRLFNFDFDFAVPPGEYDVFIGSLPVHVPEVLGRVLMSTDAVAYSPRVVVAEGAALDLGVFFMPRLNDVAVNAIFGNTTDLLLPAVPGEPFVPVFE